MARGAGAGRAGRGAEEARARAAGRRSARQEDRRAGAGDQRGGRSAPSGPRRWSNSKNKWRRCWERRWPPRPRDGDGHPDRTAAGHRPHVRGARAAARHLLPAAPAPARRAAAAAARPGRSARGGARRGARRCCTSRASWTWPRRRSTPPCSTRGSTSAPSARCTASWPRTREVRERRDQLRHPVYAAPELLARRPNQVWSWDITKLLGPGQVDLLLPVRHPRRLQPLRRRLDGGPPRERHAGRAAHPRDVRPPGHRPRAADHPRRPRLVDDLQARRVPARRPRRHQDPLPAARLQRQPVLRGAVQDPEVPPGLPGALRLDPGCPSLLPRLLPLVQRRAPSQRPRPADARTTSTTAWPSSASRRARPCSPRPTRRIPSASPAGSPSRRRVPRKCGSTDPKPRATAFYTNSREPAVSFHAGSSRLDPRRVSG